MRRRSLLTLTGAAIVGALAPTGPAEASTPTQVARLESILTGTSSTTAPLGHAELASAVTAAKRAFAGCHYDRLTAALPRLVAASHEARSTATGTTRDQLGVIEAEFYHLTSELAVKLNEDGMAWVAADRARSIATETGDLACITNATHRLSVAMRRQGHHDGAITLLTDAALALGVDRGKPSDLALALYGNMMCTASYTAAQKGDHGQAITLINEAEAASAQLGDLTVPDTAFSAANLRLYRISIHNTLGDPAKGLHFASMINPKDLPTTERYARYCMDTARAWLAHGRIDRAYQVLQAAETQAPQELRRPSVRTLISTMLYTPGHQPGGLRDMATRVGAA